MISRKIFSFDRPSFLLRSVMLVLLWCASGTLSGQNIPRILCLGDKLTAGYFMVDSVKNRYPMQLQNMLLGRYQVDQVSSKGSFADAVSKLLPSQADLFILEISLADLKLPTEVLHAVGDHVRHLKTNGARVILLADLLSPGSDTEKENLSLLQQFVRRAEAELIDPSRLLKAQPEHILSNMFISTLGAATLARRVYEAVVLDIDAGFDVSSGLTATVKAIDFHGYAGLSFSVSGHEAQVIRPRVVAKGAPWVWRARFWGHEPQFDLAMLERGYHIAYCDVAELFGNKEALQIWDRFYQQLRHAGLHPKAVMEGMSRGGIYVYNWVLRYPDRVSAVYADAPVLDFKSWPGGKGKGPGSLVDWELFKKNYNLSEGDALAFQGSPLDRATAIGQLGIPLLHVVGDRDEVVPTAENTLPFRDRVVQAGGSIALIHKPEVGHHPHSLEDPSPIVDFALQAEGRKINFATVAAPGSEYRSGAGWSPNLGWWGEHRDIDRILRSKDRKLDILFLGNSITQGIGGTRTRVGHKPGFAAFDQAFQGLVWDCAGISGDRTQNVLWRLQQGGYSAAGPKVIVLTIGVNNLLNGDNAAEIAAGILAIKDWIVKNLPQTKLILTGPLPVGISPEDPRRLKYRQIHDILRQSYLEPLVFYTPMDACFVQSDGTLSREDYAADGIHLQGKGYEKWAKALFMILARKGRDK